MKTYQLHELKSGKLLFTYKANSTKNAIEHFKQAPIKHGKYRMKFYNERIGDIELKNIMAGIR